VQPEKKKKKKKKNDHKAVPKQKEEYWHGEPSSWE
jgi:hypothetical protein